MFNDSPFGALTQWWCVYGSIGFQSKKEGKDQESIKSSTTPDPGSQWEIDNLTIRHHKREPRAQPFPSRRPQGNYEKMGTKKHV